MDNNFSTAQHSTVPIASTVDSRARMLKYVAVFVLTTQCTAAALLGTYVRARPVEMFFCTTAVSLSEAIKFLTCLTMIFLENGSFSAFYSYLNRHVFNQTTDNLRVGLLAAIYVVQSNLIYIAMSNLDATTFQVTNQLKILTTAVFSVCILRRRLSCIQWLSLLMLFIGISVVQIQSVNSAEVNPKKTGTTQHRPIIGFMAVGFAAVTSGFASVHFEKLLKTNEPSVWVRNLQLSFLSMPVAVLAAYFRDGESISSKGFLYGYDKLVWTHITLQAFGGLTVAMVTKFADSIIKGFATSASIVLACACSAVFFSFSISYHFTAGAFLVIIAVYLYSRYPPNAKLAATVTITAPLPMTSTFTIQAANAV